MDWTPETGADSAARVKDAVETLEALVDRAGLGNVLESLSLVCEEKVDHIRANWQDTKTANVWANAARVIDRCAARVRLLRL